MVWASRSASRKWSRRGSGAPRGGGGGEPLRLAQMVEEGLEVTQRDERVAEVEAQVDGPGGPVRVLGKVPEAQQRPLEVGRRLAEGAARGGLPACLAGGARGPG